MKALDLHRKNSTGGPTGDDGLAGNTVASPADGQPPVEQPYGVSESTTPSGLSIYYQAGPKRIYRICPSETGPDAPLWQEVPSVSTVLDILEKGGLSWWGMKVGIAGTLGIIRDYPDKVLSLTEGIVDSYEGAVEWFVEELKAQKLTVNHVRDKAADRGTNVHSALEAWVETGITPDPEVFPENERGYVAGLVAFINDAHPHPLASELMVASTEGYAGRFDLLANLDFAGEVVTKTYPKRKPVRENVNGVWLLDLKTSKSVYTTYHLQLAAYRKAMEECGYGTADQTGVVRLTDDGRYELVRGVAQYEDFLAILNAYRALKGLPK